MHRRASLSTAIAASAEGARTMTAPAIDVGDFMSREAPALLAYFTRRLEHAEDAADLLSDTLIVAWRKSRQLPSDPTRARMWLYGVARNVLATHRRGSTRRNALAARLRDELAHRANDDTDHRNRDTVRSAVAQLNATDQEIVGLVYWEGFSLEQVARIMSMRPATVRSRHARARTRLRELLLRGSDDE
jgi:RNA polymerase sigma-70 factor, ECF subfamily